LMFPLLVLLGLASVASAADSTLTLFKVPAGNCMDGTPAAYYYRPSPSGSSALWLFSLQGGGACFDEKTCTSRSKSKLGSSKNYKSTMGPTKDWMSADPKVNPDFHDANTVYVPYCSSDTHRGQQNSTSPETWGFYFSGHRNLVEIVKDIKLKHAATFAGMKQALLTGGSAGGVGVIYNADWLGSVLPPAATLKAAPVGGWFFPGNFPDQIEAHRSWCTPSLYPDFVAGTATNCTVQGLGVDALWDSFYGECADVLKDKSYQCSTVHVMYHHVHTPMYVMEYMYDKNQIEVQGLMPAADAKTPDGKRYQEYFGAGMRNSTLSLKPGDGIFLASCLGHTEGLSVGGTTPIQGKFSGEVLGDWFFNRPTSDLILRDTCDASHGNLPCNQECHTGPSPSPGPAPSSKCAQALEKDCPDAQFPTPSKCGQCAKQHRADLLLHGCTLNSVTSACEARKKVWKTNPE